VSLYRYDKQYFEKKANETGFIRDNIEKVYRVTDILEYLNKNPLHKSSLALKGGTAINLAVFNMPRLSADIDLDFCKAISREETLEERQEIFVDLTTYLQTQGYTLDLKKGKNYHSLSSLVFWYIGSSGNRDNIKVEINYSMRVHALPIVEIPIQTDILQRSFSIMTLSPLELFGSKIKALVERTASRDLYDVNNMVYYGTFDRNEIPLLRKLFVFYYAVGGAKEVELEIDTSKIGKVTQAEVKKSLLPMLRRGLNFDLESAKTRVEGFLAELLKLEREEIEFLKCFKERKYRPELLFTDAEIVNRIRSHPMALWKVGNVL